MSLYKNEPVSVIRLGRDSILCPAQLDFYRRMTQSSVDCGSEDTRCKMTMDKKLVFVGTIAYSASLKELNIYNGFICVLNGRITNKGTLKEFTELQNVGELDDYQIIQLDQDQFIMPGFVDCHTHASQFPNIGLGLDRPLLEWLPKYTYPLEIKYNDTKFAATVYDKVVRSLIKNGTTTACYFGTMHYEGTLELVKSVTKHRQRALVGKVSMNIRNDAGYYQSTDTELAESELFVETVKGLKNDLVQPVVTPRGGVSCDQELITGLAKIAKKHDCFVQSHISENLEEIELVLKKNNNCSSFADVYEVCSLLNDKCILAHAVHLTDAEMALLSERGTSISHCPAANTRINSGFCPVLKLIRNKLIVGLGTDISAGDTASILDIMRRAMDVSMSADNGGETLSWKEAFYLATLGGARALRLDNKIGSFEIGKDFDALLIDVYAKDGQVTRYEGFPPFTPGSKDYSESLLQRFIYVGDDRNIAQVYVKGEKVKSK